MSRTDPSNPVPQSHPTGERRAELERIRDQVWPPNESAEDRKGRIERNLAAFGSRPQWNVDAAVLKQILEEPDNDYFGE